MDRWVDVWMDRRTDGRMDVSSDGTAGRQSVGWMRMRGGWVVYWQVSNY